MIFDYTFTAVPCSISQQHQNSMMEYEIQAQTLSPVARATNRSSVIIQTSNSQETQENKRSLEKKDALL
ncbi:hypothetical protein PENARI_c003G02489 [Penicillium arizonense]|uniref:Uncharacterized protein n=1 Tax=Penicillium arizonense TaxID=1835702 RepID=A0A1F5LTH5_PENAI|nr:hypothetical protein PENARI_c003G02489 [Penicillium arizonense]OGE56512.1 hypothetical protein PENARI_c003G02489 [Penicillium arizonense]